jgi:mannonate dehydratase
MFETMRWFGEDDPVSLADIRQCGAGGVVTALHDTPPDVAWTAERTRALGARIAGAGLAWSVVESIPVHDSVKRGAPEARRMTELWIESLRAVAAAGVEVVCYNFMPVLDWTRTDLDHPLPSGATALRFDATAFAAFDIHVLKRPGAEASVTPERRAAAAAYADRLDDAAVARLTQSIIAGLPGGMSGDHDLDGLREALARYAGVTREALLANIVAFQSTVAPEAERLGVRLAIHPDDPPRPLLGLPRAVSTRADFAAMFGATPARANGLTWCLGSLSAGVAADALAIGADHADRIHFAHLRVVETDADDPESFQEAAHLEGAVSLIDAVALLLGEEARRGDVIPMRPDHGWRMLGDLSRRTNPGYGLYGRMRGLAEMRGVAAALRRAQTPAARPDAAGVH